MEQIKLADFDLSIALLANGFMIGIRIKLLMFAGPSLHYVCEAVTFTVNHGREFQSVSMISVEKGDNSEQIN